MWKYNGIDPSLVLFVSATLASVSSDSGVMESSDSYSCCKDPTITFDQNCAATFTIDNKPVASSVTSDCIAPCQSIESGRMTLDHCVNGTLMLVYSEGSEVTKEKRIFIHGEPCSADSMRNKMAAGQRGSVGLLLLAVGIAGLFVIR